MRWRKKKKKQSQSIDQVMKSIKLDQKYEKNFEDDYKKVFNLNSISLIFDIREDLKKILKNQIIYQHVSRQNE